MNVERTIEHLLQLHARAEHRMDRTDRQIQGIQKLIRIGMKQIVDIGKAQKEAQAAHKEAQQEWSFKFNALIDAQQRTDAKIEKLTDLWLKRPPNGKGKH